MLASLLCIQHRQVSGTLPPSVLGRSFEHRTDELVSECKDDELFFGCPNDVKNEVTSGIKKYKKEARKLVKDREKIKSYISVIAAAEHVPEEMQRVKDVATDGSLADKLNDRHCDIDVTLLFTVQCYLYYCKCKQQNDDDAILLLLF